jgi:hypothetical protein
MRRSAIIAILSVLAVAAFCSSSSAGGEKMIEKTFPRAEVLDIETVLGECIIKGVSGDEIRVTIVYDYDDEEWEAKFREKGRKLILKEEFLVSDPDDGESSWSIEVPEGIEIKFKTATGEFTAENITGDMRVKTATGKITISGFEGELEASSGTGRIVLTDSEGEFELSSGTGSVKLDQCKGDFDASSGTGSVKAYDLDLESEGEFSSGTGGVEVSLPGGDAYELSISSGTGSAVLRCQGDRFEGYIELTARKDSGRIKSHLDFDGEEEYYRGDDEYMRKYLTKGSDDRKIKVSTGTGKAQLKK